jgi:hypothetical protein
VHDTEIIRNTKPLLARLEDLRKRETDFLDKATLYTSILDLLKTLKQYPLGDNSIYDILAQHLFHIGPDYYDYAAAFSEQNFTRGFPIQQGYHCSSCVGVIGPDIFGSRFKCLDCLIKDLCADCYAGWERSTDEMDFCKGHVFYEIPRSCWYQFKEGVVLENGSTLPEMIDLLEEKFTTLLEITRGGDNSTD